MRRSLPYIVLLTSVTLLTGCYSAIEQQFQYGNYDTAIRSSLEKIRHSRKRDQYIDLALRAFQEGMAEDKQRIAYLKANNSDNRNWGKIYHTYNSMIIKQDAIEPYLPLRYTNGTIVDLELYDLTAVREEAREGAAEYHYTQAVEWLEQGTRAAGRNAYSQLQNIRQYYINRPYRDEDLLRSHAIEMGTNKVLIVFKNSSQLYLPDTYLGELSYYDYERQVGNWTRLYRQPGDSSIFDFAIEVTVELVDMSPQQLRENHYDKHKEVEDGVQALLDENGQIVVDSSGNVVQVPKYTTLTCHVTEWSQHRSARVITAFEIYDIDDQRLAVHQRLEDHVVFENRYARANGHLDILPPETKALINNYPKPFPTDHELVLLTSESLKDQIAHAIRKNEGVLASIN